MQPLKYDADPLRFPFFLTNPFWKSAYQNENDAIDRFALRRYSTNSGTASGVTRDEAVLHGLLETVERDAISIELLRTVVSKRPAPVRRVNVSHLSPVIGSIAEQVETDDIKVIGFWEFTTFDLKIPVGLVGCLDTRTNRIAFGTGASLLADYAFERAFLEAIQTVHAYRTLPYQPEVRALPDNAPPYLGCALDRGFFAYRGGETDVVPLSFQDPAVLTAASPALQVAMICDRLAELGMVAYSRVLIEDAVSVQQVIVPELERFHVVSSGVPVLPSARGRKFLADPFM